MSPFFFYISLIVGLLGIVGGWIGLSKSIRRFEDDFNEEVRNHPRADHQAVLPRLHIKGK